MVLEGLRGYLQLATGLTDVTRERARAAARALVAQGEAGVGAVVPPVRSQVTALTEDLLATSKANRDLLMHLVRGEVERSVSRLGLVSAQDLAAETRRSHRLERRVAELEDELRRSRAATATAKKSTAKKSTAKKTGARKSTANKSAAKKSAAKKSAEKTTTAETSTAATSSVSAPESGASSAGSSE